MEEFNEVELNRLLDLVGQKIDTSDFEYQDEDYQKGLQELESKIVRIRVSLVARNDVKVKDLEADLANYKRNLVKYIADHGRLLINKSDLEAKLKIAATGFRSLDSMKLDFLQQAIVTDCLEKLKD
jgi:hypothetical protein